MPALVVRPLTPGDEEITLATRRGKIVLVDIWASWCAPCKEELPLLDDLARKLRSKGVEVLAISIDEDKAAAEAFLRARPRWSLTLAHDPGGAVPALLQPPKMPTSYIVDGKGIVRHISVGFERADIESLEARLLALTQER